MNRHIAIPRSANNQISIQVKPTETNAHLLPIHVAESAE